MRKNRFCLSILFVCIIMASAAMFHMTAYGREPIQTVKVGFFQMDGYNELDENGVYSGYDYDFFQMLGRYTSLNFEFVGYDKSWQDMQEMLSEGEIDILTSMHMTDERKKQYDFSYDIGSSYTMLTVKSGNSYYQEGETDAYDGMRVGMLSESSQNEVFDQFARDNGFTYEPVYFENVTDLTEAIQKKMVDAAVTSSLRQLSEERIVEEINESKFYAVVRKGEQELLDEINQGIAQMDLYEGDWRNNLYYKYYGYQKDGSAEVTYTPREQRVLLQYSGENEVLTVCFDPELEPYSFVEDGEMKGILPDVIGEIMDSLGIHYEYVIADSYEEYKRLYETGGADIFPEIDSEVSAAEQAQYLFTDEYFTLKVGALTKKNGYRGRNVVGIIGGKDFFSDLSIPDSRIVAYDSIEELLEAVEKEEVDIAYLLNYTAQMYMGQDKNGELTYVSEPNLSYSLCFAVNKDTPHEFCSILNKNIAAIQDKDISMLSLAYIENDWQDLSFIEYMQRHPGTAMILFLLVLVLVVAIMVLIFANIQNEKEKRINAERAAEREKQHRELQEALFAAESASRAKTAFLSNMSHDIRTPMNAIIGFSTLAEKHIDDRERAKEYVEKISSASSHLLSLINDVLDMSRIEREQFSLNEKRCNLKELMQHLEDIIMPDLEKAQLEFSCELLDISDEVVICDQLRLTQLLLNLLSNAVKFTEAGGSVHLTLQEKPGEQEEKPVYEIRVADTGIGMSEEFIGKVFEPFERERNSTVSGIQGTGLGMAISKSIVDMMGGTITVSSKKGEGTEFVVRLSLKKGSSEKTELEAAEQEVVPEEETLNADRPKDLRGKRLLLVEDNVLNREIAVDILTEEGLLVEEAEDGNIAVEKLLEKGAGYYQLVIMDIQMPIMDGYTAARMIRAFDDPELAGIPIVAMTANAFEEDKQKAMEAGMNAHVAKPIDPEVLLGTLKSLI